MLKCQKYVAFRGVCEHNDQRTGKESMVERELGGGFDIGVRAQQRSNEGDAEARTKAHGKGPVRNHEKLG